MSFLLMVFLTLVCLFDAYPAPPWFRDRASLTGADHRFAALLCTPTLAVLLTAGAVLLIAVHAFLVSRRVSWPLARDAWLRDRLLVRYERWRFIHQVAQFGLYGLALGLLGWGWAVRQLWKWDNTPLPGIEVLTLLPFLAGQLLTWVFFYDADRAAHRAAHRLLDADPFAQNRLTSLQAPASLPSSPVETEGDREPPFGGRWAYVAFQLRQKLALVFVPVLLLIAQKEVVRLFPNAWMSAINSLACVALFGVFLGMPWLLRLVLGLKPLPAGALRDRLAAVARRLGFRCSDVLLWNTRSGMANAMVIGLVPWLRYVVFTDRLIEEFPEDEVEAVFGHEVGHIRHQHMLYYLIFLTLSMAVLGMVSEHYLLPLLGDLVQSPNGGDVLGVTGEQMGKPAEAGRFAVFPIVAAVVAYIFVVFGFLSRRCERQADIFGCRAVSCRQEAHCAGHGEGVEYVPGGKGLCATGIRTFIQALEKVALVNGISRKRPGILQSWQHSTIARRVAFLQRVLLDRRVETAFQRRLAVVKWGLLLGLAAAFAWLVWLHGWKM